jgi:hypothetical protein
MTIISEDDNLLAEVQGKLINVTVGFGDVVDGVNFVRNGDSGVITREQPTLQFRLQSNCILTLTFSFVTNINGSYSVEITGDGGDTFSRSYSRSFDIPVDAKNYDFRVL